MLMTKKVKLNPTPEQEILFRKSAGVARWSYNYFIAERERIYKAYLDNDKQGEKTISENSVRKQITVLKKTTHTWLKEVGCNVIKQAVKDADIAYKRFFTTGNGRPKFKSKRKSKLSFYVNYESLSWKNGGFRGEKIGFVKTSEPLPRIQKGQHYSNPRISYDGKYWYLSVGYEVTDKQVSLTGESIGIDLGVKDLAVCSNGKKYKNINKTKRVKQLKRKLRKAQKRLSRKMEHHIVEYNSKRKPIYDKPLYNCRNFQKQKKEIQLLYRKLTNIRNNYLHQTTSEIVKTKPSRIIMEDLNITGMMKNSHLAKSIAEEKFYEFIRQMKYKCQLYGIEFLQVDRFYPSSKMCSGCGNIKRNLKLSDRIYHCDCCGLTINRDYNASRNLANYQFV